MSGGGGELEGDFLPSMEVSKKAEDWGVESESEVLMFELKHPSLPSCQHVNVSSFIQTAQRHL